MFRLFVFVTRFIISRYLASRDATLVRCSNNELRRKAQYFNIEPFSFVGKWFSRSVTRVIRSVSQLFSSWKLYELAWKLDALTVGKTGPGEKLCPTVVYRQCRVHIARSILLAPYLSIEPLTYIPSCHDCERCTNVIIIISQSKSYEGHFCAVDKLYYEQNLMRTKQGNWIDQ